MALTKQQFSGFIKQFNFRELFNEMGWNNDKTIQPISVESITFSLQAVAEKSGFKILLCNSTTNGLIPDYNTRKKIEIKVTKLFQEHLIIFSDLKKQEQIWQLVVRQAGKPTKVTETRFHISQDPELLFQRASGIFFEMDEEEKITIVDVKGRMTQNFHVNAEKVTKQFYDKFKKEHTSFLDFIKGINEKVNKEWYASLMLNRLMFCYFIQKKGFLDNNKNYLRDRLKACQIKKGQNKFYSFYRDFLLVLFHQGLNEAHQKEEIKIEIGKIPYLNGGLFDEHELEKMYKSIDIEDEAFERIFDFFDQYEWHLDTRITASGKDINPDVIGYIFEKYINDRADMGAYYTKEDITDYISKNSILPFLFDETKRQYPKAFSNDGEIMQAVKQSNDNYIYDAVKKGIEETLPEEISVGIKDVGKRTEWNKPASVNFALPTEIWREVVDRRNRYAEIKTKIDNGEITNINDFITWNLNIRQFAQDSIENTADPDFLRHFYKAISSVTILDPTCGSGAFLFAAMNILEPLYEACINRMRAFVEDEDRENEAHKSTFYNKYKYFRSVLEEIQNEHHPNLSYFIYKSIILRNLYGVDIMKEAVEIAKLRLFLKLVATVEVDYRKPNLGLEPLPDIDFNIRSGNTLVGFATYNEAVNAINERDANKNSQGQMTMGLVFEDELNVINAVKEKAEMVSMAYKRFKDSQLIIKDDLNNAKSAKLDLQGRIESLNNTLNEYLAFLYGIESGKKAKEYLFWKSTHQPFHWFAEFYEIIHDKGGFDVVIGNPPYVEYKEVNYKLKGYKTIDCGNLYAYIMERTKSIQKIEGYCGMIVPMSGHSTERMESLVKNYYSFFKSIYLFNISADAHPSTLFDGVRFRLTIFITSNNIDHKQITKYKKWFAEERDYLFEFINYTKLEGFSYKNIVPKISDKQHLSVLKKVSNNKRQLTIGVGNFMTFYHNTPVNWIRAHDFIPYFHSERDGQKSSTQLKPLIFDTQIEAEAASAIICSTLFYIWWISNSDCYHLNKPELTNFVFDYNEKHTAELSTLSHKLKKDMIDNSVRRIYIYKTSGRVEYDEFYMKKSKPIIDEIDTVLAEHYGFTAEELDFIINYDIKYRMGKELDNGDEEE